MVPSLTYGCTGNTSLSGIAAAESASRTLRILIVRSTTGITEPLPSVIGDLPELRNLQLADCFFTGSIPGTHSRVKLAG